MSALDTFAADTWLCTDDDDNGAISVLKGVGNPDRDCNHEASKVDGGPDCDDTKPDVFKGSWNTYGCSAGQYRRCDPAGSGDYTTCSAGNIHTTGYNTYYISGTGSGTACTAGAPCTVGAVSAGGAVTIVNPAEIIWTGSADLTTTTGFSTQLAGNSPSVPNLLTRDPRATGKWNMTGSFLGSAMIFSHDNWTESGFEITGGDTTAGSNPAIVVNSNDVDLSGNRIHDYQCNNDNNCGGIYLAIDLSNRHVHDNIIVNIYDSTRTARYPVGGNPDPGTRQNVFAIRGFRNHGDIYEGNLIAGKHIPDTVPYTQQMQGISQKHGWDVASCTTPTEIRYNVITNTELQGIADNSACVHTHGNLVINSGGAGIAVGPGGDGGSAAWYDILVRHNTIISSAFSTRGAAGALNFGGATTETAIAGVVVDGNVWEDSAQITYGGGNHIDMVDIANYGTDADYTALFVTKKVFSFLNNCYHNSNLSTLAGGFNAFGDNGSTALGSVVDFAGWKLSPYFQDIVGSTNGNPVLDINDKVTAVCSIGTIGWEAEWPGAVVPPVVGNSAGRLRSLRLK